MPAVVNRGEDQYLYGTNFATDQVVDISHLDEDKQVACQMRFDVVEPMATADVTTTEDVPDPDRKKVVPQPKPEPDPPVDDTPDPADTIGPNEDETGDPR